ncbi:MAG: heavy metal-binding domain-containing protein [Caulobacteraceae bacterium]
MSWFLKRPNGDNPDPAALRQAAAAADARSVEWETALAAKRLPGFVETRLAQAAAGSVPWLATMSPAELLLIRSHGLRPIATVTGTCWFQYGRSWTEGHAEGWRTALARLKAEALACGAHAVVDVKLRTAPGDLDASMDYSLVGTAVRLERLAASTNPVVATTPAIEFVRLLEADVVPTGIAIGAHYEWLTDYNGAFRSWTFGSNQPLSMLGAFWEQARRKAHQELRRDAARQGNGVLAHTQFGQLIRLEQDKAPDQYLGRHIVIGTVIDRRPGQHVPHAIETVIDMRDELSPLDRASAPAHNTYASNETESDI